MFVQYLNRELGERCRKNPRYSLRSFARSLNLSSSALSAILNKKRPLTAKTAKRILDQLDLVEETKTKLLIDVVQPASKISTKLKFFPLDSREIELVSDWEHYAILSLMQTRKFKPDVKWIAAYFNLNTGVVIEALNRLEKSGIIDRTKKPWKILKPDLTTTHDIPNAALKKVHRQTIEKALYSLDQHAVSERDITGMTLTVPIRKLPEAKKRIAEFRRSLTQYLEHDEGDDVFRLNIQFFPLHK